MREFQFYIVPTPIGNIQDITLRAIEVLKSVDVIACEDSRVTQKLLNHYDIKTKLVSYHKYNEQSRVEFFLGLLNDNKKIALVSDAGTPMICDPGSVLLNALIKNGITYTALAGASALTTFLSMTPRDDEFFTFIGFMPKKEAEIQKILSEYSNTNMVFYDSPNRIIKTLKLIQQVRGNVKVALARELTKMFEEAVVGDVEDVIQHFETEIKGEIVCMVYKTDAVLDMDLAKQISKLKKNGYSAKDISRVLSILTDIPKNEIYKQAL